MIARAPRGVKPPQTDSRTAEDGLDGREPRRAMLQCNNSINLHAGPRHHSITDLPNAMNDRVSLWDRARSVRHAASLALSERIGRVRRPAPEQPAGDLLHLTPTAADRARALAHRYGVRFELRQDAAGTLSAYEYLDLIDQAVTAWQLEVIPIGVLHDIGCASFAYVGALAALWRPERIVGIEREGYRRLRGGINRAEKAMTNVARVPGAHFVVADYAKFEERADLITAFFPFVTPAPVLGWRMPLSVLQPRLLFARIRTNLSASGSLWMVNHGESEASTAAGYAAEAGLRLARRHVCVPALRARDHAPVVSQWDLWSTGTSAATGAAPRR